MGGDPGERQLAGLTTLLTLQRRARRAADPAELGFIAVNETHQLCAYRQALLWRPGARPGRRIVAVSGLPEPDRHAPFVQWAEDMATAAAGDDIHSIDRAALPEPVRAQWGQWLPAHALWVPLRAPGGALLAALILAREAPWAESDRVLCDELGEGYGHALAALGVSDRDGRRGWLGGFRFRWLVAITAIGALLAMPVRESVLGPAEVVPLDAHVIRAPLDGVVDSLLVDPNATVAVGDALLELDDTDLRGRVAVARNAVEVAVAEHRQAAQGAVFDRDSKARLTLLEGRLNQERVALEHLEALLDRVLVQAPVAGVVVVSDSDDWRGRAVSLGERILEVADPGKVVLEVRLPVDDAITLGPGAALKLFLNIDPGRALDATLTFASYRAELTPEGSLAYRLEAEFEPGQAPPRIGLRGTARIYGEQVSLFRFVFRRPLATLRRVLGL